MQKERRMVFRRSFCLTAVFKPRCFQLRCCRSDTARSEKLISVCQRISARYVPHPICRLHRWTFRHLALSVKNRRNSAVAEVNTWVHYGFPAEANTWVRYGLPTVAKKKEERFCLIRAYPAAAAASR